MAAGGRGCGSQPSPRGRGSRRAVKWTSLMGHRVGMTHHYDMRIAQDSGLLVSVIIPTYNRWPMLGEAVESVLAQTAGDYELIVVDDGSTDETRCRLADYGSRLTVLTQRRRGVSAARNLGASRASGGYLAFLDSDDLWHPKKLQRQLDFMERSPEVEICQTDEIWIRNGVRVNPRRRHRKPSGDIFRASLELCLVSPSAVMMRRELFERLGGFDESLPVCEDYDLWLRISKDTGVPADPRGAGHQAGRTRRSAFPRHVGFRPLPRHGHRQPHRGGSGRGEGRMGLGGHGKKGYDPGPGFSQARQRSHGAGIRGAAAPGRSPWRPVRKSCIKLRLSMRRH